MSGYLLKGVLPLVVLCVALLGAKIMIDTAPTSERQPIPRQAKLVEVAHLEPGDGAAVIDTAMGLVMPAQSVQVKPQVSGRIEWLASSVEPGAYVGAGQPLLRLEAVDYELAVKQRRSDVLAAEAAIATAEAALVTAENDLAVEMGNQKVAQREFELLGETIDEDSRALVLRVPQLKAARAAVQSAEASLASAEASLTAARLQLEVAELDLARSLVATPFNAVIAEKLVDIGDVVGTTTPLFSLYGTDVFWVELSLPASQLRWVKVGDAGSRVTLSNPAAWGADQTRTGRVIRLLPEVDSEGRMARVLVRVEDPLAMRPENRGKPTLRVNDFISATIEGEQADAVLALPRFWLREGDTVWLMGEDDTLEIRPVQPLYRGREYVWIGAELTARDRIVTTDLSAPVDGMLLRTDDRPAAAADNERGGASGE